ERRRGRSTAERGSHARVLPRLEEDHEHHEHAQQDVDDGEEGQHRPGFLHSTCSHRKGLTPSRTPSRPLRSPPPSGWPLPPTPHHRPASPGPPRRGPASPPRRTGSAPAPPPPARPAR